MDHAATISAVKTVQEHTQDGQNESSCRACTDFSRLNLPPKFSRARIPAYFPARGVGEVRSEPVVKSEKRWGPLFGGIIPWT